MAMKAPREHLALLAANDGNFEAGYSFTPRGPVIGLDTGNLPGMDRTDARSVRVTRWIYGSGPRVGLDARVDQGWENSMRLFLMLWSRE